MGETIHLAIDIDRSAVGAVCREFGVKRLDVFGSVVTGLFEAGRSDVDLLVEFEVVPERDYLQLYLDLEEALARVVAHKVHLTLAGPMKNPYFRASVERERTPLYP